MNSSVASSTRKPGIDSSLSSVPPVWPSPRPLIFPNGTPHAATIGPTAIEVLSPTPPVECLSTTRRPSAPWRSTVSPVRIERVGHGERLGARQPAEEHRHAERRKLVVGHRRRLRSRARARATRRRSARRRRACARSAPRTRMRHGVDDRLAGDPATGRLAAEPRVDRRPDVGELAFVDSPGRVLARDIGEQQRVLARVVGRRRRRVAAVIRGEDSRSPGRRASSRSGSRRSKSCRQRWKLTGSFRWPQSMSVSTRLTKISPSSSSLSSRSVCCDPLDVRLRRVRLVDVAAGEDVARSCRRREPSCPRRGPATGSSAASAASEKSCRFGVRS